MATKKTATKKTPRKTARPKKAATAKATSKQAASKKSNKKMSALDAAAKVLGESKEPLNAKTLIERMAAKKYWTSPGGNRPMTRGTMRNPCRKWRRRCCTVRTCSV